MALCGDRESRSIPTAEPHEVPLECEVYRGGQRGKPNGVEWRIRRKHDCHGRFRRDGRLVQSWKETSGDSPLWER